MIPDYKNNYKKFFRQYLFVAGAILAFILIIDAFAWAGPHRNVDFNKSFTYTVPANADTVPLEREVFMMQQYVKLEKLRYEDRIDINFTITGDLKHKLIAPLLILPFIENAFKHGTSEKTGQVWINIDMNVTGNHFKLKVANNNPERQPDDDKLAGRGHIGLKNVIKRLDLLYPATSKLKIMNEDETFLIVLDMDLMVERPLKQLENA